MDGFGWNFYGFFFFAIAWIAGYFSWARYAAHQARPTHEAPGTHAAPGTTHDAP